MINQYSDLNFQLINKDVRTKSDEVEQEGFALVTACQAKAAQAANQQIGAQILSNCSNEFAEAKVADWWKFAYSLFAKFGRYAVTTNETSQTPQRYPQWWVDSIEVGFTMWAPEGPF